MKEVEFQEELFEKELSEVEEATKEGNDLEEPDEIPEDVLEYSDDELSDIEEDVEGISEDDEFSVICEELENDFGDSLSDIFVRAKTFASELKDISLNEEKQLLNKIEYTNNLRRRMEIVLSENPERAEEWDIVRGRLSGEYNREASDLRQVEREMQDYFDKLEDQYEDILSKNPDAEYELMGVADTYTKLQHYIENLQSKIAYTDMMAEKMSKDLDPAKRTVYTGIKGKEFTDIHSSLIQQQGKADRNYQGTCGLCSSANTMTLLGETTTEKEILNCARELQVCIDNKVPLFAPKELKEEIRDSNGGIGLESIPHIMEHYGFQCEVEEDQSLSAIQDHIQKGCGAIIFVNADVLNKSNDVSSLNPIAANHVLTITGIESDVNGEPVGLWIHDTGGCSNMGNAFYCSKEDYEVWRNAPMCKVNYISK